MHIYKPWSRFAFGAHSARNRRETRHFAPLGTRRWAPPTRSVTLYARRFARRDLHSSARAFDAKSEKYSALCASDSIRNSLHSRIKIKTLTEIRMLFLLHDVVFSELVDVVPTLESRVVFWLFVDLGQLQVVLAAVLRAFLVSCWLSLLACSPLWRCSSSLVEAADTIKCPSRDLKSSMESNFQTNYPHNFHFIADNIEFQISWPF